ncbi:uncharacterized protein LOC129875783 [Solanum dulcamara]|uniref:uncharacterized protein LOC129875783 n=1 Tax=Solanum dulcamara TaxID=45834 RepID=UPI0024869231|nr:uncharacterized protein LOC129875783 [Solanum dulcamara]
MSPTSAAGPDGMSGKFFHSCWYIICDDLLKLVQHFFNGHYIPRYISHACLVLLPKTEHPNKLSEYRPISLSNFTSKIISKLLCLRLAPILPQLISDNQSEFVKGRSISENIMLAQEIIHNIKRPTVGDNVVIKLVMAKAYDRVSWSFTCMVMRRMRFREVFIDMVWRIMSNNWYSVIINGVIHGVFHSTRGLKQGDPLSPALFIIGAEVLSRMLNNLNQHYLYTRFHMERKGPQVNHLSFADDVLIFTATNNFSMTLISKTLKVYETTSGQLINKDKSQFMLPLNTNPDIIDRIGRITGYKCTHGPITYLGCPVYIGRQRIIYYIASGGMIGWKIRKYAPPQLVQQILSTEVDHHSNTADQACWKLTSHGNFTSKSAWEIVRKKIAKTLIDRCTWHANIPFKVSFLLWRAVRQKIHTNDKLVQFGAAPLMGDNTRDLLTEKYTDEVVDCQVQYHATLSHMVVLQHLSNSTWSNYSTSTAGGGSFNSRSSLLVGFNFAGTMFKDQQPTIDLHQLNNININCKSSITSAEVKATNHHQQQPNINNRSQRKPPTLNKYIMQHQKN